MPIVKSCFTSLLSMSVSRRSFCASFNFSLEASKAFLIYLRDLRFAFKYEHPSLCTGSWSLKIWIPPQMQQCLFIEAFIRTEFEWESYSNMKLHMPVEMISKIFQPIYFSLTQGECPSPHWHFSFRFVNLNLFLVPTCYNIYRICYFYYRWYSTLFHRWNGLLFLCWITSIFTFHDLTRKIWWIKWDMALDRTTATTRRKNIWQQWY